MHTGNHFYATFEKILVVVHIKLGGRTNSEYDPLTITAGMQTVKSILAGFPPNHLPIHFVKSLKYLLTHSLYSHYRPPFTFSFIKHFGHVLMHLLGMSACKSCAFHADAIYSHS